MNENEYQAKAQTQQTLAETRQAEGQCPDCGTYRSDGRFPVLHRDGCPRHEEGIQMGFEYLLMDGVKDER